MKKRIYYILTIILCLMGGAGTTYTHAQLPTDEKSVYIYVSPAGSFDNVGDSWEHAKNNLQSAIDQLNERTDVKGGSKRGYVFVAGTEDNGAAEIAGRPESEWSMSATYIPNRRSTDDADGSVVNTSFRIYQNIYVIGGFRGDEELPSSSDPEYAYCSTLRELPNMRWLSSGKRYGEMIALHDRGEQDESRSWDLKYKSILSGNHHTNNYSFKYDEKRGVYNTTFPLSSYHVVWFGTEGVIDPSSMELYEPNINKETEDDATPIGGVYYILNANAGTATVTRPKSGSYSGSINIPATITIGTGTTTTTYKVTEIRNGAFADYTGITSVTIGNNVTTIGQGAFYGCTGLTSVTLGNNVTDIMRFAFYGCKKDLEEGDETTPAFRTIAFPNSIKLIDRWAFGDCENLSTATVPVTVNYIGRYAFKNTGIETSTLPVYEKEETEMTGRYKGLPNKSKVAGFTIEGGNASSTNLQGHDHTGFGGGVYMVRNTEIEDCIIHHCSAVQRGGGVYLDGGGDVNYCYIHTCQATGFGMQQGYGGGVCVDYDGQVEHCYITQCAGRAGAGLAICHDPDEYPEETAPMADVTFANNYKGHEDQEASAYDPFAKATLITNCTSNAEGAGVYLNYGGSLDHVTVVNNECIGPDVIYYGMRHGRTGGIYVREAGAISNTVVWGNKCGVNSDIQFAAFKNEDYFNISIDHSAFSKGDITDWSAVLRKAVINLNDANYPTATFNTGNFPMFENPSSGAGIIHSSGVVNPSDTVRGSAYQDAYYWHPLGMSSMRGKGKQIVDVTIASRAELMHANATQDLLGIKFESVSVCGAITNSYHDVVYKLMPSLEKEEGRKTSETTNIPTIFVDPTLVAKDAESGGGNVGYKEDQALGANWTYALNNLQDAVYFFGQYLVDPIDETNCTSAHYEGTTNSYYRLPALDGDGHIQRDGEGNIVYDETHYPNVQILVKEGSTNVAGRGAYLTGHIRTAAIRPVSKMRLYGGYPQSQVDVESVPQITGRQPYKYKTEVRADVTGGDFNDHSVHVFSIANHHDVIIDGFRLVGGNGNIAKPDPTQMSDKDYAEEMAFYSSVANGGGLAMNNSNETFRRDMTGNILRNCVISNCAAPEGAGIFVNGDADHSSKYIDDDSEKGYRKCKAELTVVNTIIRNCTAGDTWENPDRYVANDVTPILDQITDYGVCTANGSGAKIVLRNCDVVNNCGFPFKCTPINSISVTPGDRTYGGKLTRAVAETPGSDFSKIGNIEVYNSVVFSNGLRVHPDRSGINSTVFCSKESWYNVSGEYIYMGYDVMLPRDYIKVEGSGDDDTKYPDAGLEERLNSKHIYRILTHNKSENNTEKETRKIDGSQQGIGSGLTVTVRHPDFVNPSRNVGHSTTDDKSFYGGAVNYEPLPTNPIVNAANASVAKDEGMGQNTAGEVCMSYDIALGTRDYGGDPDIGAIETQRLPKAGTVLYVTPDGAGKRDGSSWANAIAGNTIYALNETVDAAGTDGFELDANERRVSDRIINTTGDGSAIVGTQNNNGVLTTDPRYCGGFARSWFTDINAGGSSTTTVTYTWTEGKKVYDNGTRAGEEEPIPGSSEPAISTQTDIDNPGSSIPGFVAGYFDDDRYPYGEISGASRSFWRANPHKNTTGWECDYASRSAFITACNDPSTGFIKNDRSERYVGGLQYAVEKATTYNTLSESDPGRIAGVDSVQVWVSNGIYTDYKGFVMRDKTTVMGGFPAKDGGTPGLDERQALMSAIIDIPKSRQAKDLAPADYETVLQISDVDPKQDNETLNPAAVKYWDDDWTKVSSSNTTNYAYKTRSITHHFKADPSDEPINLTGTYVQYSDMKNGKNNVWASPTTTNVVDGIRYYTFGTATAEKDCWHISVPNDNYNRRIQDFGETGGSIYENGVAVETSNEDAHLRNGTLTGVNVWQTLKNVSEGDYFITIDLAAFYYDDYKNNNGNQGNTNVNVKLQVVDSTNLVVLHESDVYYYKARNALNRYKVSFTLTSQANVSVKLIVGPGLDRDNNEVEVPDDYTLPTVSYNSNLVNRREINMDNLRLYKVELSDNYTEDVSALEEEISDRTVDNPLPSETNDDVVYEVVEVNHRTSLRKRVLTMPDVCVPTYGAGRVGINPATNNTHSASDGDNLSHTDRVSVASTKDKRTSSTLTKYEDPNYVEYSKVIWDGFTIRHGFIYDERMAHGGGAGVNMYEGAHLRNCIVINNMSSCSGVKGAGMFCDGATSTIEGCFVLNNTSTHGTLPIANGSTEQKQIFAGGMFMYEGTCFNSLFAKNYSYGSAGGLGFCVGRFFNNTIAYNTCLMSEGGAISLATSSTPNLFVANTIIYGNSGIAIRDRQGESGGSTVSSINPFLHCYIQSEVAQLHEATIRNVENYSEDHKNCYGIGNVFLNGPENGGTPSATNTPFAADLNNNGDYIGAENHNDFRLLEDLPDCINGGTEAFSGTLYDALTYKGKKPAEIDAMVVYQNVLSTKLPDKDVVFADRVQDCRIDMGAYEFDGTRSIEPTLYPDDKKAIFFVTKEGSGFASARSASDAACSEKFQKVLDAAGRWRYGSYNLFNEDSKTQENNNFDINRFRQELKDAGVADDVNAQAITDELSNLKDYEVIVRLEGNYNYKSDPKWEPFSYVPTRSVNPNSGSENVLMYSLIVPHGIRVEGGYEYTFDTVAKPRDVLGRPTYLDGTVNESGGQAYHVVTFTNDLFTVEEKLFNDGTTDLHDQLDFLGKEETYTGTDAEKAAKKEYNRVVLDGVFLQNGNAAGSEEYYQNGGAAIVTDYAHIRNCVVQNNNASGCGGGLYLDERALVSGCIIKENTADYGAGIYVFEPSSDVGDATSIKTYAHILTSTIANNTATVSAGGLFFATNVRANSVAIWHNSANANPNVAGTDATGMTQLVENYPMNYCGVESRRMAGVNNIELPAAADQGVRWNTDMVYETGTGQIYFPITMASVLTRTGMPYASYLEMRAKYPTLELTDIFGLNRLEQGLEKYTEGDPPVEKYRPYHLTLANGSTYDKEEKDNAFIEIGARVLNADFQVKLEFKHIMKRLFVTTTERLPTDKAVVLQKNTASDEMKSRYGDSWDGTYPESSTEYKAAKDDVEMYKQMGSCFLNPMLRLGDALNYVVRLRQATDQPYVVDGKAIVKSTGLEETYDEGKGISYYMSVADVCKDIRFEVFICGGTFYPYKDAYGNQGESRANTFVVPEKVTIVGGVNHETAGHSYCQEGYEEDADFRRTMTIADYTLNGNTTYEIRLVRDHQDRNGNNVNEPWEMEEQTILSGAAVQNDAKANVYHVVTCLVNEERVGQLPTRKDAEGKVLGPLYNAGLNPTRGDLLANIEAETQESRDARTIIIDGVTITGGYANKIDVNDEGANAQTLTYFRGGGILVEGNWDASFDDKGDLPEVLGVAKRDVPLMLTSCLIKDNVAGNGGGLYSNGTIYNYGCHYTQNLAIGPVTEEDQKYIPWTAGGAIATNYECHVWNTLFDNNEARRAPYPITNGSVFNADARQGYAGVISSSETSLVRACNCDFVRNKAVAFPAIYNFFDNNLRAATSALTPSDPNYYGKGWHFAVNSIFWGNEATGSTVAPAQGWEDTFYANIYGSDWKTTGTGDEREPRDVANFGPKLDVATLTFCSYEEGTGRDGTVWWSNQDNAKSAPIQPVTYKHKDGTEEENVDGLTRLYQGRFTDVLDKYFGYYKNGDSEHPYYINENPADATSKYIPSALDNEHLKLDGNNVYGTGEGQINYTTMTTNYPADNYEDEMARYQYLMGANGLNAVAYNYNLVLSKNNTETGGPFFVLPSLSAGVDGYMETANWLVSRLNNTIDTGWGFLKQDVKQPDESTGLYDTKLLKSTTWKNGDEVVEELIPAGYKLVLKTDGTPLTYYERYYKDSEEDSEHDVGDPIKIIIPREQKLVYSATDVPIFADNPIELGEVDGHTYYRRVFLLEDDTEDGGSSIYDPLNHECLEEQYHDLYGDGFYNIHSKNLHLRFHEVGYPDLLPIGDDVYMNYTREGSDEVLNMRRISTHPKMGVQDVFIDMGIYEYQYIQLVTSGAETDVIWVGPNEIPGADGSSCEKATTNLQEAIETLLRSRNDHDKMIKIIGGTYSPQPTVNSTNKAFIIEVPSRTDGITLPKTLNADQTHTVKTLTIRGGYPDDITALDDGEDRRDIEAYPVVFEMRKETGNSEQSLAHLFIIEDAGEKGCFMNYLTKTNKDFRDNVMPIVLDGITFCNPYGENEDDGGAAIFYKPQYRRRETTGNNFEPEMDHLLQAATYKIDETEYAIPKLIIKNCIVKASGANKEVSAVKIEKGGGPTVIANTVFHSNSGNPVEAVNTKIVNSTFALNGGHIRLIDEQEVYFTTEEHPVAPKDYPSGLYNSIIWRDNQAYPAEEKMIFRLQDLAHNKVYTEKSDMPMKYNAISKPNTDPTAQGDVYIENDNPNNIVDNAWLHRTNRNVFLGPNFADPKETFAEGMSDAEKLEQKKARDFHINPSARFINKADSTTYLSIVPFYAEQSLQKQITVIKNSEEQEPYIFQSVQRLDRPKTVIVGETTHTYYPRPLTEKNLKGTETVSDIESLVEPYPFRQSIATVERWDEDAVPPAEKVTIVSRTPSVRTLLPYTEHELAYKYRYDGAGMELGAYECAAALQRVLYVWEGSSETPDGSSWLKAFKRDELQNAIDVASIYSTIKSERAYVFVASDNYPKESVKVRDGVSVFGGVPGDYFGLAKHDDNGTYTDSHINAYINDVNNVRSMTGASVSTIVGLESDENATDPNLGFMLDGFVLRATGLEGTPSSVNKTPFHLDKHLTVLKNCVVTGNNVTGGKPVIKMDHGLLYNSLVYGNTVTSGTPVVEVKTATDTKQAGVLNCTVVADHTEEVAISADAAGSVVNTITYNEAEKSIGRTDGTAFVSCNTDTENMFAPYFRAGANAYDDLPVAFTEMRPLWYQLVETSGYINAGQDTTTTMGTTDNPTIFTPYAEFINYTDIATDESGPDVIVGLAGDRDPLGNPRLIGGTPDIGCFETWYVDGNYKATNQTDVYLVSNYGGHKYPHRGSVVYVMENSNLVVDTHDDPATTDVIETDPAFTGEGALRPGYVLVKNGGSIYGQGNTLEFSYVAAERNFSGQQYALVGMPFVVNHVDKALDAYYYNGETRSAYNYQFLDANSTAWEKTTEAIPACEGWLADMGESFSGTVRFTGWGDDLLTYAYSESGDSKTVLLTQYDNRISGTGSGLNFTREEDMGWNLKGLPYLVANYHTYDPASGDDYHMNIPHIFYKDNTTDYPDYLDNSTVETVQSWESTATLSPGYGFFTQTAVIDVKSGENLVFKVPIYGGDEPAYAPARPIVLMRDLDNQGDLLTVNPDEGAPKTINYSLGRDGVKWMMTDAPQLYLLSAAKSRLSLLGAAPTEVDIPLGVSVPEDPRYQDMQRQFTFSLPESEAFADYSRVWLIDRALNRVTNLMETNYAAALSPGTDNSRFYLRIGDFPFGNDQRREYIVYAWKRQLHIRGLVEGDQIRVYSLTGQLVLSTTAKDPEFTAELPQAGGIYAVRVNDFSTKVRNL